MIQKREQGGKQRHFLLIKVQQEKKSRYARIRIFTSAKTLKGQRSLRTNGEHIGHASSLRALRLVSSTECVTRILGICL